MPTDATYTISDLARLAGLNVRTIRYWIAQGLVPASGESGPGAHYGDGHLDRLRLIKRLQAEYLPNAEIRRRLAPLSDADVASLVAEPGDMDVERPTTSALEYVRGILGQPAQPIPGDAMRPSPPPAAEAPMPARASAPGPQPAKAARGWPLRALRRTAEPSITELHAAIEPVEPVEPVAPDERATAEPTRRTETTETTTPERSQWERLQLTDDIELHIRRPLSRIEQRRVERLITIARQVLTEDQS